MNGGASQSTSNRARILHSATVLPGIHLRELARLLGLSLHSVRYHVESLSRTGQIICEKNGRYSRIFPIGTPESDMALYSLLRNKSIRKTVLALCSSSKLSNKEICEKTGLAKSTVSEIVQKLLETEIVQLEFSNAGTAIGFQDPNHVKKLLQNANLDVKPGIVDTYIDLWDF
jgi:predicted transcriptional regulator